MIKIFSNKPLNVWKSDYEKADLKRVCFLIGGGERAWTADQRIMSPLLLPTELHPLKFSFGVMNRTWTDIQRNHNLRLYR